MKVVKVLWADSCNSNLNWITKEDVEVELVNIDSFGVVVKETDEFVSIAQNYGSEPEQYSNIVTIPRGCIKEIFVIHDDNYVRQGEPKPALAKVGEDGSMDKSWHPKKQGKQKLVETKPHLPDGSIPYDRGFEEAQEYLSKRGFDVPWNDCDVYVDERHITQTVANVLTWADEHPKQKPEWSEEDEYQYNTIFHTLNMRKYVHEKKCDEEEAKRYEVLSNWLKSLKDRVLPQPKQEWSEEDKRALSDAIIALSVYYANGDIPNILPSQLLEDAERLKSLRPQNTWKPSKEQMKALESATENCAYSEYQDCLRELIKQLKKLREE